MHLNFGCVLDDSHSDWNEVEFPYCFDLHFICARDGEHFFMCLLAICTSSFENCLFSLFVHLFVKLHILWELVFLAVFLK
jgi:hypothetical protein